MSRDKNESLEIWRKLDRESTYSYSCFEFFLNLGPSRTVLHAYQAKTGKPKGKNPTSSWRQWSTKNEWYRRAEAYDSNLANLQREQTEKQLREDRGRWLARKHKIREADYADSKLLRAKAREILALPIVETTETAEEVQEDGRTIIRRTVIHKPLRSTLAEVVSMFNMADRLGRLSADMVTERVITETSEEERLRHLEDARRAYQESEVLFPKETALARAEAIAAAYQFTVDQIMQTPSLSSDSVQ